MTNIEFINNDEEKEIDNYKKDVLWQLDKKKLSYSVLEISSYRKGAKAYKLFNENTLFLSKKNLIIFWERTFWDKETTYNLTLYEFLKKINLVKNKIYIYRNWNIIECFRKESKYYDWNWKEIKIFFWDIISTNTEAFKQLVSIDKIEEKIGFLKVKWIYKLTNNILLLKIKTIYTNKVIDILYDNKTNKIWSLKWKISDVFLEDIKFYKKFNETFEYFKWVNMFDEPINEKILPNGEREQLDWNLRVVAIKALRKWQNYFEYRWIKYPMFINGKPNIPQVCIDFVLDFYEKLHNSYYDNKWNHPDILNFEKLFWWFYERRRVRYIIEAIKNNVNNINKYLVLKKLPDDLQISYNMWEKILKIIKNKLSKFVHIWDILIIKWPLDDWKIHYHSCLVSNITQNNDIIVEENTNYPHKETLIRVLSRAAKRKVVYIIRPTKKLLTVK